MTEGKYILAGHLIDGSGGAVQKSVCLVVAGGVITAIKKVADVEITEGGNSIDLSHCTIMPPLIDYSLKLSRSAATDERLRQNNKATEYAEIAKIIQQNIHYCHSHGVLGCVDTDDLHGFVSKFRREEAELLSIEIQTSSETLQNGADYLRVINSARIEMSDGKSDFIPLCHGTELSELLKKAGRRKGVVLANGEAAVREAVTAGCGAIEQGYFMGEKNLEIMAENEVLWIPTVLQAKAARERTSGKKKIYFQTALENQVQQLRQAKKLGVKIVLGTGSGSSGIIHGDSMVEEIKHFQKAGFSLVESLQCASGNGAQFFSLKNSGMLTVGQAATFIVSRGMVQQLPRKLSYLEDIYISGEASRAYRKNPVKTVYKR